MYLNADSLIDINNKITGSNNITLRKFNVKQYGYYKMYMDKNLTKGKLYELIDQMNEKDINHKDLSFALFNSIHTFYDGNESTCQILFVANFK